MKQKRKQFIAACALILSLPLWIPCASAVEYTGSESYRAGKYFQSLSQVNSTGDLRGDLVRVAHSQIGYQEGSSVDQLSGLICGKSNYTEYGQWYGYQTDWSATFVSWCADQAAVSTDIIPNHCDVVEGFDWFVARGLAYSRSEVQTRKYTPRPGDLIYFKSNRSSKSVNHVGIVTGFYGGKIYTIEGDSRSAGTITNGGMVTTNTYPITNNYIVYICSPNYGTAGTNVPTAKRWYGPRLPLSNDWHRHILPEKYLHIINKDW